MRIIHISFGKGGKLEGREKYVKYPELKGLQHFDVSSPDCYGLLMFWKCEGLKGLVKVNLCNFKIIYS